MPIGRSFGTRQSGKLRKKTTRKTTENRKRSRLASPIDAYAHHIAISTHPDYRRRAADASVGSVLAIRFHARLGWWIGPDRDAGHAARSARQARRASTVRDQRDRWRPDRNRSGVEF